jgi:hypothetical protein
MNRQQRRAAARGARRGRGPDCGCSHCAIREAVGQCGDCGQPSAFVVPPMPTSQGVGESAPMGWMCAQCGGEVEGVGTVVEVVHG